MFSSGIGHATYGGAIFACLATTSLAVQTQVGAPRSDLIPEPVRAAAEARGPRRTSYAEFSLALAAGAHIFVAAPLEGMGVPSDAKVIQRAGLFERPLPLVERFISESVADTVLQTDAGDADGFRSLDFERSVPLLGDYDAATQSSIVADHARPRFTLLCDDAVWSHAEGSILASGETPDWASRLGFPDSVLDLGTLGARPILALGALMDGVDAQSGLPGPYGSFPWAQGRRDSRKDGTTRVETLALEHVGRSCRVEWTLDGSRGMQPVRTTLYEGERAMYSSATSLREVQGRWVPETVEFYRHDFQGGIRPYATVRVSDISFDEPWHRQEPFTLDDIGLAFGTQLRVNLPGYEHVSSKLGYANMMYWDGTEPVPADDYWAMIYLHGMEPDPSVVDALNEGTTGTRESFTQGLRAWAPSFRKRWQATYGEITIPERRKNVAEDDWDAYVRKFVDEHQLPDQRTEAAYRLLKHMKGLRDWHEDKYRRAIEQAKQAGETQRAEKLEEPVERLFRFLKRGLLRLLPPSERKPRP